MCAPRFFDTEAGWRTAGDVWWCRAVLELRRARKGAARIPLRGNSGSSSCNSGSVEKQLRSKGKEHNLRKLWRREPGEKRCPKLYVGSTKLQEHEIILQHLRAISNRGDTYLVAGHLHDVHGGRVEELCYSVIDGISKESRGGDREKNLRKLESSLQHEPSNPPLFGILQHELSNPSLFGILQNEPSNPPLSGILQHEPSNLPLFGNLQHELSNPSLFGSLQHELTNPPLFGSLQHEPSNPPLFGIVQHEPSNLPLFGSLQHELSNPSLFGILQHELTNPPLFGSLQHELSNPPLF
ncbi:hypothetical protein NDU88_000632 [Pleurodeles waltl]|uniref:Uncharacterized protein n=1 Tax=Pleurodeles waltl TaxID=8319 RepID=A0AAV7Q0T6_PLEWA|nr:hypothetical protein NDU88_000632 [Pleurodeles waltl]